MPVESAADLAVFFNADEHATAATWTLAGGVKAWPVTVILDRPVAALPLGEAAVQLARPVARIRVSQLPAGYGKGDVLVAGADSWTVERVDPGATRAVADVILKAR